jgi:hypothetical protein
MSISLSTQHSLLSTELIGGDMPPRIEGTVPYTQPLQTSGDEAIVAPELKTPDKEQQTESKDSTSAQPQTPKPSTTDSSLRKAEHSLQGQIQATRLQAQIPDQKPLRIDGQISQPAPKDAQKTDNTSSAPSMQQIMTNSGMKDVKNPPSDADLKTYYSSKAPAHDLIAKNEYGKAAGEYRKLADAETNQAEKTRLTSAANQLDMAQKMKDAKVGNLSFPPSESNVKSYFATMKGKPLSDIKNAYEDYAKAFYVHSETKGVDKGDVVYDKTKHTYNGKLYETTAPEKWSDISDRRELHPDGRRIVDCEGYALMGQKCFEAAGFKPVEFAVMSRVDNPNTKDNESFTQQHIMVTARRTTKTADNKEQTEVAVISNDKFYSDVSTENPKGRDFDKFRSGTIVGAYRDTFKEYTNGKRIQWGGEFVIGNEAWKTAIDLDDYLKSKNKPALKQ